MRFAVGPATAVGATIIEVKATSDGSSCPGAVYLWTSNSVGFRMISRTILYTPVVGIAVRKGHVGGGPCCRKSAGTGNGWLIRSVTRNDACDKGSSVGDGTGRSSPGSSCDTAKDESSLVAPWLLLSGLLRRERKGHSVWRVVCPSARARVFTPVRYSCSSPGIVSSSPRGEYLA